MRVAGPAAESYTLVRCEEHCRSPQAGLVAVESRHLVRAVAAKRPANTVL